MLPRGSRFGWQVCLLPANSWVSFDGKELKGIIDAVAGQKRGLCIVRPLLQQSSISLPGLFYHGAKDSEIICVRELFREDHLASQRLTRAASALRHYIPRARRWNW